MSAVAVGGIVLVAVALAFVAWPMLNRPHARRQTVPGQHLDAAAERAEDLIRAARGTLSTCAVCGTISPEPAARFCSTCGADLSKRA